VVEETKARTHRTPTPKAFASPTQVVRTHSTSLRGSCDAPYQPNARASVAAVVHRRPSSRRRWSSKTHRQDAGQPQSQDGYVPVEKSKEAIDATTNGM